MVKNQEQFQYLPSDLGQNNFYAFAALWFTPSRGDTVIPQHLACYVIAASTKKEAEETLREGIIVGLLGSIHAKEENTPAKVIVCGLDINHTITKIISGDTSYEHQQVFEISTSDLYSPSPG